MPRPFQFKYLFFLVIIIVISSCKNIDRRVDNIGTFAKLYGYVRWFHPSDEAQVVDWNKLAVLGIKKVESINSDTELKDALLELFSPIVQGLKIYDAGEQQVFDKSGLIPPQENQSRVVSWQHYGVSGVSTKNGSNVYKSLRTNSNDETAISSFGNYILVDSSLVRRKIKFTGHFRYTDGAEKATMFICPIKARDINESIASLLTQSTKVQIVSDNWTSLE